MGGNQPSMLDGYFNKNALVPDELPSHTFVATGNIEVPKRSDTIAGTIRRPSLSIKRSLSKLRRRSSISHTSETRSTSKDDARLGRSDSVETRKSARPLRMQSSLSRLRQRVGLDRDLSASPPTSQRVTPEPRGAPGAIRKHDLPISLSASPPSSQRTTPEPQAAPAPIRKNDLPLRAYESPPPSHRVTPEPQVAPTPLRKNDLPLRAYVSPLSSLRGTPELQAAPAAVPKNDLPLRAYASLSRDTSSSSSATKPRKPIASTFITRKPPSSQREPSFVGRKPSTIQQKTFQPPHHQTSAPPPRPAQPPSRPKRADSGTAIGFEKVPAQQRPLPFQEIMAVKSFAERMAMYKRTREYWAYAEHGLVEWTGKAAGPKIRT
jgi:hypothetical protein